MTDDSDDPPIICANPECRVSTTGKCVEGLDLSTCPTYGRTTDDIKGDSADSVASISQPVPTELPGRGLALPPGTALTVEGARLELGRNSCRVIALIGPTESGKTSLIAGIYDLFQTGPIGTISFGRSSTLQAFEQVCHDARMASRRDAPHSQRTPIAQVRFYHLGLMRDGASACVTLLLGDRAGEDYAAVADDVGNAKTFPEVIRADTVTILIDGGKLLDTANRHRAKSQARLVLQGLKDGRAISADQQLAVVLTKLDLVQASPLNDRVESDFQSLLQQIRTTFGEDFSSIKEFRIAASPHNGEVRRGEGVLALLEYWLSRENAPIPVKAPNVLSSRAFGRFAQREEAF